MTNILPGSIQAQLSSSTPLRLDPRPEYVRVQVSVPVGGPVAVATPTGNQVSSRQASMATANGLMVLPARSEKMDQVSSGFEANVILIGSLMSPVNLAEYKP